MISLNLPSLKLARISGATWYVHSKPFTISNANIIHMISIKAVAANALIFTKKIAGAICGNLFVVLKEPWIVKINRIIMWTSL